MSGTRRSIRLIFAAATAALATVFPAVSAMAQSHAAGDSRAHAAGGAWGKAKQAALRGPHVFGWGFNRPAAVSSDGTHLWVADTSGDSVIELNAKTGALVKVITGSNNEFAEPRAASADGSHVWVLMSSWVTELNAATGAVVKVITASSYGFNQTGDISSDGTHVWVTNQAGNSVTELNAATGALVKVIKGSS